MIWDDEGFEGPARIEIRRSAQSTILEGYAAVFGPLSSDLGGFREKIQPGAFARSLREQPDVKLLVNHQGLAIARTTNGSLVLNEDGSGLRFRATLNPDDGEAMSILAKIRRGDTSQMPFAFKTIADRWEKTPTGEIRTLLEVRLDEISVVTFPAYPAASLAAAAFAPVRSSPRWRPSTDHLRRRLKLAELDCAPAVH